MWSMGCGLLTLGLGSWTSSLGITSPLTEGPE